MIVYFDSPFSKTYNPLIEYDHLKKLPPQYTFNLLTKDKKIIKRITKKKIINHK